MKLYSYWRSSAAYRVRIALNLKQLDYQLVPVHLLKNGGEQFGEHYHRLNPQHRLPALQLDDGWVLTQSLAIIEYLDERYPEPPLLPQSAEGRAWVRSLAQLIGCDIHPLNNLRVLRYLSDWGGHDSDQNAHWYRHWLQLGLGEFDAMLTRAPQNWCSKGRFCVGDSVSLADLLLIPQLYNAHRYELDLSSLPRLLEIEQHCMSLEAFHQAAPEQQPDAA
ncbi:maleylacetoacetate isomerase [Motiliproteus sp.]|uniref:maleylacetoacetate isomerase n=1 Tax=Motiliproteus sp. TaxID=1898955 RepID=UPI003BABB8C9